MTRRIPIVLARLLHVVFALFLPVCVAHAAGVLPTVTNATLVKQGQTLTYLIQVSGANFTPSSMVTLNGAYLQTTYLSPTQIQTTGNLSAGAASATIGAITLGVAGQSNSLNVPVKDAFALYVKGPNSVLLLSPVAFNVTFGPGAPANTALTWSVNGIVGGNSTVGTINAAGMYTAPSRMPAVSTVTIGAASVVAGNVNSSMPIALQMPYPQVTSYTASKVGNSLTFLVDLKGSGYLPGILINANGASQVANYLSANEIQANVTVPVGTTILKVSASQPGLASITSPTFSIPVTQAVTVSVTGNSAPNLGSRNTYAAAVAGTTNTAVTWQVNGVTGGTAQTGFITAAGVYSVPYALPGVPVNITAVSAAAQQCSGTLSLTIQNTAPTISSASATQVAGATTFPVDVRGTGFTSNSVIQANGSAVSTTYIAPTELQGSVVVPANASSVPLTVLNPSTSGGVSNAYTLTFTKVAVTATAASRLLDQASFGPNVATIQHVQQVGLTGYLTEQFAASPTLFTPIGTPLPAACLTDGEPHNCAESDFWRVSVTGTDQLRQRVAYALSEIFTVAMPTVYGNLIPPYYNTLEKDAFGNFSTLMKDVTLTQAMGMYLNMLNSGAPSAGQHADENFAREMMQLFTIGPYQLKADGTQQLDSNGKPIPTYTQDQVQAFARAYTGWTGSTSNGTPPPAFPISIQNYDLPMLPYQAAHDTSSKQLLNGVTLPAGQTAQQDLDGALSNLFQHPNVGPFVGRQLIQHLVTSNPSPAYVARIAAVFANNGAGVRGDLKAVITAILMDPEARAGDTDATVDGGHLREPILLFANVARAFGFVNTSPQGSWVGLSGLSSNAGQRVLYAPSVFSYFRPEYVIPGTTLNAPEFGIENTANAVMRMNMVNLAVRNSVVGYNADFSSFVALAAYPPDLVDTLGALLMHARMPADMRSLILNAVTQIPDNVTRTRVAMYLVLSSPQYLILH